MIEAAHIIYALSDDVDPFAITEHVEDCDVYLWIDKENQRLISPATLADRDCRACAHKWTIWDRIKEEIGDIWYGEAAWQAIDDISFCKHFPDYKYQMAPWQFEFMSAVEYEHDRITAQRSYQDRQRMRAEAAARQGPRGNVTR